jgi:hypothetical protein
MMERRICWVVLRSAAAAAGVEGTARACWATETKPEAPGETEVCEVEGLLLAACPTEPRTLRRAGTQRVAKARSESMLPFRDVMAPYTSAPVRHAALISLYKPGHVTNDSGVCARQTSTLAPVDGGHGGGSCPGAEGIGELRRMNTLPGWQGLPAALKPCARWRPLEGDNPRAGVILMS